MKRFLTLLAAAVLVIGIAAAGIAGETKILGAGATFPQPLYSKMFDVYNKQFKVRVNYQGVGSGAGIEQLTKKTVDFGATDAPMKDKDLAKAPAPIAHVPICLGAVVVTYNLPGDPQLKLSRTVLTDVFLGKITKWNDKAIAALNPGVALPSLPITIVHRSDGSGTTSIFTDYLAKISPEWKEKVGAGKEVNWPVGLGAKGNPGVAGQVKNVPGSIGYVELIYALENDMPTAMLENKSGKYITATLETTKLSADVAIPDDTRMSLTDTDAKEGYPITGLTWLILYKEQNYDGRTKDEAKALVDLMWWMTHEGQAQCEPLHYAPIPKAAVEKTEKILKSITYGGKPIRK
ncbi:MAG: phosphate ABC transporter substrate-binding protein PstS [Deltaproteobacteria bacterium]|nr:phosphate ABC transporter substrate-binding protein PstS [Candidatus Zymogenaceae bacterium]